MPSTLALLPEDLQKFYYRDINKVYCIDVGHGQLNDKIRENPKVINYKKRI